MIFLRILFICLGLALSSCASVSVRKLERLSDSVPNKVPEKILVRPFGFYEPGIRVDRSGENLERFKYDLQESFTRKLVRRLPKRVAPGEAIAATAPLPQGNIWVIEGRFDRVNQGSRLLRALIGYGIGGTKMDTSVVVSDLSGKKPKPFLLIETTGGSNASPGAIGSATYFVTGITALGSVGNLLEGVRSGVSFDTERTAREVSVTLSDYLSEEGALPPKDPERKRIGRLNFWPFNIRKAQTGTVTVTPAE